MNLLLEPDRQALAALGITTAEQLADRVSQDRQFLGQFDPAATARILATIAPVVQQRSRSFLVRSRSFTRGTIRNFRFDVLLLLVLSLVVAALFRDLHVAPPPAPVLASKDGVLPFHVIASSDLRLSCTSDNLPAKQMQDNFVGHYSFEFLEPCSPIVPKKLSSGKRLDKELNGRSILRLKVQPTSVFAGMHTPFKAILLVAPTERGTSSLLVNDLFVLDLQKDGDGMSAVVAVLSTEEPTLASFVGHSNLYLVARQP